MAPSRARRGPNPHTLSTGFRVWCIRWKRLNNDRPMRTKVVSHRLRTVNGDCIPHERDGAADPSVDLFLRGCLKRFPLVRVD
jgi:hypothetical protein